MGDQAAKRLQEVEKKIQEREAVAAVERAKVRLSPFLLPPEPALSGLQTPLAGNRGEAGVAEGRTAPGVRFGRGGGSGLAKVTQWVAQVRASGPRPRPSLGGAARSAERLYSAPQ